MKFEGDLYDDEEMLEARAKSRGQKGSKNGIKGRKAPADAEEAAGFL